MYKPHAHIYSAEINKWIAGTLKLPTYLRPQSLHEADYVKYLFTSLKQYRITAESLKSVNYAFINKSRKTL